MLNADIENWNIFGNDVLHLAQAEAMERCEICIASHGTDVGKEHRMNSSVCTGGVQMGPVEASILFFLFQINLLLDIY